MEGCLWGRLRWFVLRCFGAGEGTGAVGAAEEKEKKKGDEEDAPMFGGAFFDGGCDEKPKKETLAIVAGGKYDGSGDTKFEEEARGATQEMFDKSDDSCLGKAKTGIAGWMLDGGSDPKPRKVEGGSSIHFNSSTDRRSKKPAHDEEVDLSVGMMLDGAGDPKPLATQPTLAGAMLDGSSDLKSKKFDSDRSSTTLRTSSDRHNRRRSQPKPRPEPIQIHNSNVHIYNAPQRDNGSSRSSGRRHSGRHRETTITSYDTTVSSDRTSPRAHLASYQRRPCSKKDFNSNDADPTPQVRGGAGSRHTRSPAEPAVSSGWPSITKTKSVGKWNWNALDDTEKGKDPEKEAGAASAWDATAVDVGDGGQASAWDAPANNNTKAADDCGSGGGAGDTWGSGDNDKANEWGNGKAEEQTGGWDTTNDNGVSNDAGANNSWDTSHDNAASSDADGNDGWGNAEEGSKQDTNWGDNDDKKDSSWGDNDDKKDSSWDDSRNTTGWGDNNETKDTGWDDNSKQDTGWDDKSRQDTSWGDGNKQDTSWDTKTHDQAETRFVSSTAAPIPDKVWGSSKRGSSKGDAKFWFPKPKSQTSKAGSVASAKTSSKPKQAASVASVTSASNKKAKAKSTWGSMFKPSFKTPSVLKRTIVPTAVDDDKPKKIPGSWSPPLESAKNKEASPKADATPKSSKTPTVQTSINPPPKSKVYWATWNDPDPSAPEQKANADSDDETVFPAHEEPLYNIPPQVATSKDLTHQVRPTKPSPYKHKLARPKYMDTHDDPYAVFVFKYRDKAVIERMLGHKVGESEEEEKERLAGLSKEEIIAELLKTRAAGSSGVGFAGSTTESSDIPPADQGNEGDGDQGAGDWGGGGGNDDTGHGWSNDDNGNSRGHSGGWGNDNANSNNNSWDTNNSNNNGGGGAWGSNDQSGGPAQGESSWGNYTAWVDDKRRGGGRGSSGGGWGSRKSASVKSDARGGSRGWGGNSGGNDSGW